MNGETQHVTRTERREVLIYATAWMNPEEREEQAQKVTLDVSTYVKCPEETNLHRQQVANRLALGGGLGGVGVKGLFGGGEKKMF